MQIVEPDFARRIDLPGAGPCPRPVDIDRERAALSRLVSLRVYSFAREMAIDGEAEGDEVFIVLMRGAADIAVAYQGEEAGDFALRTGGGPRAVYLPPHASYHLTAVEDCDIAYARVRPAGAEPRAPRGFTPGPDGLDVPDYAAGMALTLTTLAAGEALGRDDGAPERFLHVRSDDGGTAAIAETRIGDWTSAVLAEGEHATLTAENGSTDILEISAIAR